MKTTYRNTLAAALSIASICLFPTPSSAEDYNQVITAIFGSGNPDTGWTAETDPATGITLALRAKNREGGSTANTNGVYYEPVGLQAPALNRARYNFELSINSGAFNLATYDYYLVIDTDPTVGIDYQIALDVLTTYPDNSYGNNLTLNGQGVEGSAATYAGTYNVLQQSQNIVFGHYGGKIDPNVDGTYEFELIAVQKGAGVNAETAASVTITVVVGAGGKTTQQLIDDLAVGAVNHGTYVSAVTALLNDLYNDGVINKAERKALHSQAAKSNVGK